MNTIGIIQPVQNVHITSEYGWRRLKGSNTDTFHYGRDYRAPKGTPVLAILDGVVGISKMNGGGGGYGNYIVIQHDGLASLYAHLDFRHVFVGDKVKKGSVIGYSGDTGHTFGAHLHFEISTIDINNDLFWSKWRAGGAICPKRCIDPRILYTLGKNKTAQNYTDINNENIKLKTKLSEIKDYVARR